MAADALYYPWIDPPSETILVNSLLYWDHLHTIVPTTVRTPFQNQWSKAAHEYGFLKPRLVEPTCSEVYTASEEFADDLERRAIQAGVRYVEENAWKSNRKGYRIYPGKLSSRLMPENLAPAWRKRIWTDPQPDSDGCLRMSPGYALSYMSRLASVIAESDSLTCYSNQAWSRNIVIDRYVDKPGRDDVSANEARLAALSIDTIRIRSDVSLADIIRFRESHQTELERYRKAIHSLALQVSAAGTAKLQEREIQRVVRDQFKPAHEAIGAKLTEAGCDFGTNALQVSVAAGVGALAGGALLAALASVGVGIVFSVVRWRIAQNRARRDPLAYLLALRTRFHEENT